MAEIPVSNVGHVAQAHGVRVSIHHSDGSDGAVVVQIDTEFEPDHHAGPDQPGLRILLNDGDAYVGVPYRPDVKSD